MNMCSLEMNRQHIDPLMMLRQMASQLLLENPLILEHLVDIMHSCANDLQKVANNIRKRNGEMIEDESHISPKILAIKNSIKLEEVKDTNEGMTPSQFKDKLVEMMMIKVALTSDDIDKICKDGRGHEVLRMLETLQRPIPSVSTPSRRRND